MRRNIFIVFIYTLLISGLGFSQLNSASYSSSSCSNSGFETALLDGYTPQLTSAFISSTEILTTQISVFVDPTNPMFQLASWDGVESVGFYLKSVNPMDLCTDGPEIYDLSYVQTSSFSSFNNGINITNLLPGTCYRIYTGVKYSGDPDIYYSIDNLIIYTAPTLNSYAQSQSFCSSSTPLFSSLASVNTSNSVQFPSRVYSLTMVNNNNQNLVTLSSVATTGNYTIKPRVQYEDGTTIDGVVGTIAIQVVAQPLFQNPITSFTVAQNNQEFTLQYTGSPTNFTGYRKNTEMTSFTPIPTNTSKIYYVLNPISSSPLTILPTHTNPTLATGVTQSVLNANLQPSGSNYFHTYRLYNLECGFQNTTVQVFRLPTPSVTGYSSQTVCSSTQINQLANPGTVTIGSRNYTWAFFPTATETTPFVDSVIAQTTTYYVRYKLVENGNTYYSDTYATISVTVLDPTTGAVSGTQTICQGNTPSVISSSTNGSSTSGIVSYEWQSNASGSYATISGATDATYQPGALTATTSYQRRTVSTSGSTSCYSAYTTPITITVNSSVLAGTVSGSQTICSGSSATGVHVSGHQGSIQWQSSTDNINFTNITGQTEPTLSTGSLSTTTYYRAVVTFSGCSGYSTTGTVNVLSSGSWLGASGVTITPAMYNNASNWCGGVVPTSPTIPPGVTVYMDGSYDFTNVTIECGGSLIITSTGRVNITNVLTNNGLVHVINGGTIHYGTTSVGECPGTYEITQNFAPSRYWYVGPTTTNTVRTDFGSVASTNNQTGTQMWSWNEATNATNGYITPLYSTGTTLIPGKGYVYRNLGATTLDVNVTGPYITTPISHTGLTRTGTGVLAGYHLFSNPYTAYLDADDLFNNNSGTTNLVSSIWVRSNSTANGGAATMVFDTYNASSGIGTGLGWQTAALNGNPGGISNLMRWIAPMQGFWVRVNTTGSGSLAYNYNMAEANPVGAGQLRTTSPISGLARLNVNFGDQKDQMVAALSANATNGFEAFDSEKMFTSGVVQVYAPNSGKKLAINTLKNNKSKVSMPLTVECPGAGWYSFDLVELILENGVVFLEDKLNGEMKDLTIDSSYQFYANSGVLQNRFILHFHLPSAISNVTGPTAIEDLVSESQSATIDITSTGSGKVTVALDQVDEVTNSAVRICDLNGRVVDSFMADGKSFEFQINQGQGAYLIEVTNGLTVEKKKVFIQ